MNVVSVTSKYLLDAITELGCWEDDSDDFELVGNINLKIKC